MSRSRVPKDPASLQASPRVLPQHVALYMRVSTEDQADRGTIDAQRDFLRQFASLYQLSVADEYADDGVSGTLSLDKRPEGHRLLQDAEAGRFGCVLVYRLTRLGRSLNALIDAYDVLSRFGVTIRSAQEPFDTSTPIGVFLFQLLGSLAQLDRAQVLEQLSRGRDRVARNGRWTDGPIPYGYQLDKAGCLIPSTRLIDKVKMTESAIVQDLFQRVAAGGTTSVAAASRFNALGIPTTRYHSNGTVRKAGQRWYPARIVQMITCPTYKGTHIYKSRFGAIEREVPPLVDAPLWEVANAQLQRNRKLPKGNASRVYLLRRLITCGRCGATYTGQSITYRSGNPGAFYRCGGRRPHHFANGIRCDSKAVQAAWLEGIVWDDCRGFIRNPGQALAEAQRQLQDRQHDVAAVELERSMYHKALMEKAKARDDILLLVRRGAIALNDAQSHLTDIAREEDTIRGQLAAIDAQRALVDAHTAYIQDAQRMLERLHTQLQEIETAEAQDIRCQVVAMLVREIRIDTHPDRSLTAEITYAFRPAHVAHNATARRSETLSCPAGPLHPYV